MLRILSDTHLGRNAAAHTTNASRQLLDKAIFNNGKLAAKTDGTTIHVGDLFDKASNKESVILQGISIAKDCDLVVGANHDLPNRNDVKSSIELVNAYTENVVWTPVGKAYHEHFEDDEGCLFSIVPHHNNQQLFDQALEECLDSFSGKKDILFLHCNYNNFHAQNDASLNLTPEQGEKILEKYHYIVLGHEHNHRWELSNKLLIVGNTHPTSFGDISDKYYWDYCPKKKEFTKTKVFDLELGFIRINVKQLLAGEFTLDAQSFVEISGKDVDPSLAGDISKAMHDLWQTHSSMLMLRNNVEYRQLSAAKVDSGAQLEDVTKAISSKLKGTDLSELWNKCLSEVQE